MTIYNLSMTEEKLKRWREEGRGTGEGADYLGWLTVHDINSQGNKHRFRESLHGRVCHWFSDAEYEVGMVFNACPYTTELLDQVALDFDETRAIAADAGIEYPRDPVTRVEIVMTTDIVAKVQTAAGVVKMPRSVKKPSAFGNFNDIEHAEIERRYWTARGWQWKFASNDPRVLPPALLTNVKLLEPHRFMHEDAHPYDGFIEDNAREMLRALMTKRVSQTLGEFCTALDAHRGLDAGRALKLAYYLISRHELRADLSGLRLDRQDILDIRSRTVEWHQSGQAERGAA